MPKLAVILDLESHRSVSDAPIMLNFGLPKTLQLDQLLSFIIWLDREDPGIVFANLAAAFAFPRNVCVSTKHFFKT